jgi:hypothetical protein
MTSKQCTAIARALDLTDADEAHLMLLAQTDRAPERLKSLLHQVRLRSMLRTVEAFLMAYLPEKWRHSSRPWMPWQRCGPTSKRGGFPLTPQRTLAHSPALHHEKEQTMAL